MPAAYVVVEQTIHDPEPMAKYRAGSQEVLKQYGGSVLVASAFVESIETVQDEPWEPERFLVVKFDDVEAARRWYTSPEYAELIEYRKPAAKTRIILAESVI
jgi:uncharacterized protein (DUF1330 family)